MGHQVNKHLGSTLHDNGVNFAVWAPFAKEVNLLLTVEFDSKKIPMASDGKGYWSVDDVDAKAGQSYLYEITTPSGEKLKRNDPYARQLTDSDNGASIIVVHDFKWGDAEHFSAVEHNKAIIYELHIGTFHRPDASTAGTFYTAIEKLDYLKSLGVNYIELMPITSMAQSYGWGYAPNYIFSVEHAYGGRRGLLEFVKACHEKGIGVILDVVYNHFFNKTDLWQYDGWSENDRGGIYFYNDERGVTPWGGRPDYGRAEVRQFILDNVAMWLSEFKIDGLRVDSTIYMRNSDGSNDKPELDITDAWSLLGEINNLAHKINPNALLIAEDNSSNPGIVQPTTKDGMGFNAQWEIGFPHVIRDSLGITNNPDQPRLDGIKYELDHTYTGNAFDKVIFSDSHDTAANGSVRLNEAVTPGNAGSVFARQRTLLASAATLTAPGIPMLLQGQEFMQEGAFNDWQMLDWAKTGQFAGIVLAHQHLINLRLNTFDNTRGLLGQSTQLFHRDDANNIIGFHRWDKGGPLDDTLVIINFDKVRLQNYELSLPDSGEWRVRFNSSWKGYSPDFHDTPTEIISADDAKKASINMSEFSVLILSKD
ncbi:MAG: putative 1,4-alpha-glucan branching enzyme [Candidatus Saccharibacteria bacterium]|nr:putative 1,4-alpha-glucan branching enzyme [Candidatus Saccharibacteria bacterium]